MVSPRLLTALDRMDADGELQLVIFEWKVSSWTRLFREVMLSMEFEPTGKTVLEVGAHNGGLSMFFASLGCNVICSDVNVRYMSDAKQLHLARQSSITSCTYLSTDIQRLPLRGDSLDVVVMKSVLGGVYECAGKDAAIAGINEIYRVLKKGGLCILLEQSVGDPAYRWLRARRFPNRNWHYFRKEEFLQADQASLMREFDSVEIKCLTFFTHILEDAFPSSKTLVCAAAIADKIVNRVVADNWKHLIGVVAVK